MDSNTYRNSNIFDDNNQITLTCGEVFYDLIYRGRQSAHLYTFELLTGECVALSTHDVLIYSPSTSITERKNAWVARYGVDFILKHFPRTGREIAALIGV
jgi:hypothetical protein